MDDNTSFWSENDYDKESIRLCVEKIKSEFGQQFSSSKSILEQHTHTMTIHDSELPDGVVFVESKEDVQKVVKICNEYKCPIIPFGIGSSFEGHVNAPYGGISIDMNNMNKILNVYQEDLLVVVQPGVTREQLNTHLRDTGLFFPIDPGANASIGGMAATRASGTNAVKYGTMKDNVIALEVVTADGQLIKTANKARKSSAGYDLTRLMVGSEGTLGISTEITLKLYGIPEVIAGGRVSFPSVKDATDAVIMTIQSGIPVARIEFLDLAQVKAINNYSKTNLPESPLLLLEFHGSESSVKEQSELFGEIASDFGGNDFEWTSNNEERSKLWQARHDAYWSCKAVRPEANIYSTDVCVPISRLSDCMIETIEDMEKNNLIGPIVSHAGDGNFHVALLIDKNSKEELKKLDTFLTRISERAIRMDGTCTGEHGIGQGKRKYMLKELGSAVNVMKQVKMAFDPYKIMNPGKLFL
ncbi:MAG: FAD-binding protein [Proteobacteria bacterium]|nr:FAD-binding protein [Pseudomonadota bacterium]MDA1135219.1 FAD-binding protein [Pseudomonadota bacterium]